MNTLQTNLRLSARNEGKIKSFESCSDVRAWSHDVTAKDRHLREWMKCDMPICVIPVSTLAGFLKTMTCKSRRKVAPRCHPECKSKVLLDSICTSCHAMRECLHQDDKFEKYFIEEELETSQWPCERCLDALKNIKMYWKIIIDKIFNINLTKCDQFESDCNNGDNMRSIAKAWESEMVQQAMYVKNLTPELGEFSPKRDTRSEFSQRTIKSWPAEEKYYSKHTTRIRRTLPTSPRLDRRIERDRKSQIKRHSKHSRSTNVVLKTVDAACDTCFLEKENEEIRAQKKNLQVLQDKYNGHVEEVDRLKRENTSLRIELENVYKSCPWRASFYCPRSDDHKTVPKPFETGLEDSSLGPAQNIDSEMIITMKKCKHENFKHVSLLQVLHKTNEPRSEDPDNGTSCKKEDPIEILTKVHNTFGAIVKREMNIVNERRHRPKKQFTDIEATFHRINTSKSAPSCSTLSRLSSELNFVSTNDASDRCFK